ncbi:MAG: thermonuclease family protein [Microgenomates group bacterium]|jgi:micrococcal nuclease
MNEETMVKFKFFLLSFILLVSGLIFLFIGFNQVSNSFNNSEETINISTSSAQIQLTASSGIIGEEVKVIRVVDGDTIVIESGEKIRYIGVDTPETVDPRRAVACFGKEASNENKKLVAGKTVTLTKDVSDKDQFGRLLRFVYLKQDDGNLIFVNDYLIRNGFAKASTYPPDVKFAVQFVEAEKEARNSARGLWKMCP